jgi:hypothetical protein
MHKFISKKVKFTTISTKEIKIENGNVTGVPLEDFTVIGEYSKERADKVAKKHFSGKNVVVTNVYNFSIVYRMKTEKFIEMAEEVEKEE